MRKPIDFDTLVANYSNSEGRRSEKPRSFTQEGYSRTGAMSQEQYVELILSRIEANRIDITQDEQDWVHCLLGFATTFGPEGRDYAQRMSQFWVGKDKSYSSDDVDKKYDWCLANGQGKFTAATFVMIAKDYGVDVSMPPGCYPEDSAQAPTTAKSTRPKETDSTKQEGNRVESVKKFLDSIVEFRYNTILECVEARNKAEGTPWVRMDDRIRNNLFTLTHKSGIMVSSAAFDAYIQSEYFAPKYDPVAEYFDALPTWDPSQKDYIDDFFDRITFDDSNGRAALYRKYCKKWFLNFVGLMTGKVPDNQLMLNFIGPQNVGKTFFCKNILPVVFREDYFHTVHPKDKLDKDQMLALSGFLLILFDELKITSKTNETFKSMLSVEKTELRASYGRFAKTRKRKASIVATGNDDIYIHDMQGNRRFVSIKVLGTKDLFENPLPYEGAYAQALYLIQQPDFRSSLSREEVAELEQNNLDHIEADVVSEAICSFYRIPKDGEDGKNVSCADILEKVGEKLRGQKIGAREIGIALSRLGFPKKRINGNTRYYVVEIKSQEYDQECAEQGEAFRIEKQQDRNTANNDAETYSTEHADNESDIFRSAAVEALYNDKDDDDDEPT